MNAPERFLLPDFQGQRDRRLLASDRAGARGWLKLLRLLPDSLYFAAIRRSTGL